MAVDELSSRLNLLLPSSTSVSNLHSALAMRNSTHDPALANKPEVDAPDRTDSSTATVGSTLPSLMSSQKAREAVTKLLKGKEQEWTAVAMKSGPLTLLDLPVDVLQEIIKEVTHTNDLAAIALSHSALHALAIPQIYSRFDIVWPDSNAQSEPRAGVDALTYGLATLVKGEDVFMGTAPQQQDTPSHPTCCTNCGHIATTPPPLEPVSPRIPYHTKKRRRGNHYAEFTRKFSLGNGPADWVQEYMVNKEGGKMLGTLVSLAVARMRRLETFTWDMPTGILQDVWDALASLGEHTDGQPCRLEKVWVRWHNSSKIEGNYETPVPPAPETPFVFWQPYSATVTGSVPERYLNKKNKVERPTFSALPPLKSLSVLDIDECAYLDELSILIAKSRESLRELRIGIAEHAVTCEWAHPWEGTRLSQYPKDGSIGTSHWERRLGGVIGVLVGYIYDHRYNEEVSRRKNGGLSEEDEDADQDTRPDTEAVASPNISATHVTTQRPSSSATPLSRGPVVRRNKRIVPKFIEHLQSSDAFLRAIEQDNFTTGEALQSKLNLEILELERVALSPTFLAAAFNWRSIRDLTILNCPGHASLWNYLRREYCNAGDKASAPDRLRIRKIHTNTVTAQLMNFLKDLDPNTLEILFLQQSSYHKSTVSIGSIMRAVRHHRGSLRKLLIDSRHSDMRSEVFLIGWQRWMLNREMVHFISSGRMPKLRELSVAIDHRDWHHLLQRLPRMHHLRSINLPYIECEEGKLLESGSARERALQIIDIITLRPDIELCYLGIMGKCFEILETRVGRGGWRHDDGDKAERNADRDYDDDDDDDPDADDDDDDDADIDGQAAGSAAEDADEDDTTDEEDGADGSQGGGHEDEDHEGSATSDDDAAEREAAAALDEDDIDDSDTGGDEAAAGCSAAAGAAPKTAVKFDLREILFYDDKVAIFKARHGRL